MYACVPVYLGDDVIMCKSVHWSICKVVMKMRNACTHVCMCVCVHLHMIIIMFALHDIFVCTDVMMS